MLQRTILACFVGISSAAYVIQDDYEPSTFASQFDFFTDTDPTEGYVNYIDQSTAQNEGLYRVDGDQVYIGVDNTNVASGRGRDSVRISSKASYNHGLFILDLAHMPGGQCGTWPAFWLLGPNWPNGGEVDIIEGVNSQRTNKMTLHTSSGCTITNRGQFSGQLAYDNCDINAPDQPYNTGCGINTTRDDSYGTGFNAVGGGVYATEWTSEHFAIWFFPRSAIPADITSGNPNPENWGLPMSEFSGNCDLDAKFQDQQIIFDITFCGVWAGYDWNFDTTCNTRASTCNDYVQNNPTAFAETYWQINSLKVFQENGAPAPTTTVGTTRTTTTLSSTTQTTFATTTITTTVSTTTTAAFSDTTTMTTASSSAGNTTSTQSPPFANSTTTTQLVNATTTTLPPFANTTTSSDVPTDTDTILTITITAPGSVAAPSTISGIVIPTDLPSIITFTTIITSCPPTTSATSTDSTFDAEQTVSPEFADGDDDDDDDENEDGGDDDNNDDDDESDNVNGGDNEDNGGESEDDDNDQDWQSDWSNWRTSWSRRQRLRY